MDINQMTLREKIGQLIVTGFQSDTMTEEYTKLVKEYKVANTILFSYNINSKKQIKKLCSSIQKLVKEETGEYAFITIDQEGGVVTRLPKDSVNIPGAMAMAETQDMDRTYQAAYLTGCKLKELGINFNLAPDMDINSNSENPVIGVRSFGENSKVVSDFGCAMIKGYLDAGIMCLAKHFPGHGDTEVDSHLSLPCITKTYEELEKMELIPFRNAISNGVPSIMLAHILFPAIEKQSIPATMSEEIITEILKKKLLFNGLIVSDCLEMNAIKEYYGTSIGAKNAVKAGVDLLLISHTAEVAKEAVLEIERAVTCGEIQMSRIDEAVSKVLKYKALYAAPAFDNVDLEVKEEEIDFVRGLFRDGIHYVNRESKNHPIIGSNPLFLSCGAYRSTLASSAISDNIRFDSYMKKELGGDCIPFSVNPSFDEINRILSEIRGKSYSDLVIGTYNGHLNRGQIALAKELQKEKLPMIMVALRNPYDLDELPDSVIKIAAYEYSEQSFEVVKELISG